jgi:hypothetical protein
MDTFYTEIIKKEIDGKNAAIHEYDSMLWKLRIGFLTLYFGGWGLLFTTFMKIRNDESLFIDFNTILSVLAIITLVICLGGWRIDLNYSRRKYRVINTLNRLYGIIFKKDGLDNPSAHEISELMQASGTQTDKSYRECKGYQKEMNVLFFVYCLPVLVMLIGVVILFRI